MSEVPLLLSVEYFSNEDLLSRVSLGSNGGFCDERSESRKGIRQWMRIIALFTEEVCLVLKYELTRFS